MSHLGQIGTWVYEGLVWVAPKEAADSVLVVLENKVEDLKEISSEPRLCPDNPVILNWGLFFHPPLPGGFGTVQTFLVITTRARSCYWH